MRSLITDPLDVARIETGTLSVSAEASEVSFLVDRARNSFLSGDGRNYIHIEMELDLPQVMADRRRIVQVLVNLLTDAARHSPEPSPITMSVRRTGYHVAFSVADEGVGVTADRLPHLFRKHSRIEEQDPSGIEGSGGTGDLQGDSGGPRRPYLGRERGTRQGRTVLLRSPHGRGRPIRRVGKSVPVLWPDA